MAMQLFLWVFAVIGVLVTAIIVFFALGWGLSHWVAKAQLRRITRRGPLTTPPEHPESPVISPIN